MPATVPRRRALIAYVAGLATIAGLMSVVVLGGGTTSKLAIKATPSHVTVSKEP